mgnify:FL=1
MDGILPIWKPKGMTSHDCVFKVRKHLKMKKVGHTGTLDPEVEGVLPLCLGKATKIVPFLTDTDKTYVATLCLGAATDTEDQTGEILVTKKVEQALSIEEIRSVLDQFQGEIEQTVPLYSAVKVKGKKLYEYARENIEVERPRRKIQIHELHFIDTNYDRNRNHQEIVIEVSCSKGTYIRTLCKDIGEALGYPAHMKKLIRTKSGIFTKEDTIPLDTVLSMGQDKLKEYLQPMSAGVTHLDVLAVDDVTMQRVLYGQKLQLPDKELTTPYFRVEFQGRLLAIYEIHDNGEEIKPVRVFT